MTAIHWDASHAVARSETAQPTSSIPQQGSNARIFAASIIRQAPFAAIEEFNNAGPDVYWPVDSVNTSGTTGHPGPPHSEDRSVWKATSGAGHRPLGDRRPPFR